MYSYLNMNSEGILSEGLEVNEEYFIGNWRKDDVYYYMII